MPRSTQSLRPCSNGSSMPSPTENPPASEQPRLAASIAPGPAAGDHREAGLGQRRAQRPALRVLGVVARGARGAEHGDRARQLGEHAEALDELGLDAHHPPRVGVHPVARAARVEQPLVGGGRLVAALAAQHHRAALLLLGMRRLARARPSAARAHAARVVSPRCQPRGNGAGRPRHSVISRGFDVLLAGVREVRVAGAVVQRRDAERREPGDVGPAVLGARRRLPVAARNSCAAGAARPGSAPGARSVTATSKPSNTSRTCCSAAADVAVGGEPEVDRDHALVGHHVAGDPAGDPHRLQALAVAAAVDVDLRGRGRPASRSQHRRRRAWMALSPSHDRAECARRPRVRDLHPQRALAAGLDGAVRRLAEDREVGGAASRGARARCGPSPLRAASTSSQS